MYTHILYILYTHNCTHMCTYIHIYVTNIFVHYCLSYIYIYTYIYKYIYIYSFHVGRKKDLTLIIVFVNTEIQNALQVKIKSEAKVSLEC